ncbi:MAG: Ig-like domain-containing protein [Roseivirga sp.]|nr:Ig-like domain-containing protein [Roseivirga sp.]
MYGTFLWMLMGLFCGQPATEISAIYEAEQEVISISGMQPEQQSEWQVSVFFGDELSEDLPPVAGKLSYQTDKIIFRPKYGFSSGSLYTVLIKSKESLKLIYRGQVTIPAEVKIASTFVTNVFPTTTSLPMNQLKLYIEFSAPMRMGRAYEHIKLYRLPEGIPEDEAFLTMPEELWDPERKRLTVFFDPGRIKRGVQPNRQLGLPLVEGRSYKLVIDSLWLDINGAALTKGFEREFQVVAVDRESPYPDAWELEVPGLNTVDALVVNFGESLDYGLLHSALIVLNSSGNPVRGTISLSNEESSWYFKPERPWLVGGYKLVINPWLEDLAGNNLRRKFDIDLQNPADTPKELEEVTLPFQITQNN